MELLEREQCFADLNDWLTSSVEQGGCVTLVHGEAGIGKTALLQEFSRQQRVAPRVLWGACDALFTPRPLAPLHDIARQTQGKLLAAVNAETSRDAIFIAALDELEHGPPALVVFEDCHWADEATFDLLKFLGRRMQRTRSMLVMTYRTDEVGSRHPCRFVIGDLPCSIVRRLPLQPLSEVAVAKLAKQAGRSSQGLYNTTGGNPFFVTEVLATGAESIPSNARDVVLARLAKLPPSARAIAELVSIVPGKAEAWLLEQAGVHDEAGIESCLGIGMVRDESGSLAFRHDLARRALEDSLSQAQQQSLHAKVLAILGTRPGIPPARLAHHADGARNAVEVLRFAPAAAAHAGVVGAHREAVSHYLAALRYADNLPPAERAQLLEQLSYECYLTDQVQRAIDSRREALEIWRVQGARLQEGDALRWLSRLNWLEGRRAEADGYGAAAVAVLESLPPGPELAMAYSNRAQLDMLAADADSAVKWAQRTLQLAEQAGYDEISCHALNNLGTARLIAGNDAGWDDLNRSLMLALAQGFQEHAARAYTNLAAMAIQRKQYSAGSRYLSEGLTYCERHDLDSWRFYMMAWRGRARFEQGDWLGSCRGCAGNRLRGRQRTDRAHSGAHDSRALAHSTRRSGRGHAVRGGARAGRSHDGDAAAQRCRAGCRRGSMDRRRSSACRAGGAARLRLGAHASRSVDERRAGAMAVACWRIRAAAYRHRRAVRAGDFRRLARRGQSVAGARLSVRAGERVGIGRRAGAARSTDDPGASRCDRRSECTAAANARAGDAPHPARLAHVDSYEHARAHQTRG